MCHILIAPGMYRIKIFSHKGSYRPFHSLPVSHNAIAVLQPVKSHSIFIVQMQLLFTENNWVFVKHFIHLSALSVFFLCLTMRGTNMRKLRSK